MQGEYGIVAMLHGCEGLEAGTTILALDMGVNCLSNVVFSQKLPDGLKNISYIGHAVSVQDSSGAIIGCGQFNTLFPVDASYRGKTAFSQYTPYLPALLADTLNLDILQYNVLEGIAGACYNKTAIFDPWSPPLMKVGPKNTPDQFPVGDLSNRQPGLPSWLNEFPLIGSATILGHVVCTDYHICIETFATEMHEVNCACIQLSMYVIHNVYFMLMSPCMETV